MKRKRATGGGRKPKGEFSQLTSSLTIRIPEEMRKQLESEAAAKGQSIAQVLLWHLRRSFSRERELARNSATRAFCFLIAELADKITWAAPREWQRDPFFFRSFKIGVAKLLDAFEPEGEMRPPQKFLITKEQEADLLRQANKGELPQVGVRWGHRVKNMWKSPTSAATEAVGLTLYNLHSAAAPRESDWDGFLDHRDERVRSAAKFSLMQQERTWYGMPNVRRDLGLSPEKAEPGDLKLNPKTKPGSEKND